MKYLLFGGCIILGLTGCTSVQLQESTLGQGKTFTDLEYTMVLDNIAMFTAHHDSLPWQLQLTQGSISINDSINPSFNYTWSTISRTLGISASRGWQEGWTVVPVVDNSQLKSLQSIYQSNVDHKPQWYEVGVPGPCCPSGHYGTTFVWVKPEHIKDLTTLVLQVLETTKSTGPASLVLPGPIPRIGG